MATTSHDLGDAFRADQGPGRIGRTLVSLAVATFVILMILLVLGLAS